MKRVTGKELENMGRDIAAPFLLSILSVETSAADSESQQASSQTDIEIGNILRLLPGKRLVAIGKWEGRSVIVKLFFQKKHWQRHIERERTGSGQITAAGISTPQTYLFTIFADGHGGVMINEYLEGGEGVGSLLEASDFKSQWLTSKVLSTIMSCYSKGLWQSDIHLNNFFLYKEQVVLLDAAAIKVETPGNIVPEKSRLENLALFFAQFPVWHDQHLESLLDNVNYQGVDELRISSVTEFVKLVKKARKHRIAAYSKKLTRSSTAHLVEHRTDRMMVCDRAILSNELNNFVDTPDKYIDQGETIKAGNTSTVAIVNINQKRYLVKRYNIKNWAHDLRRIFGRIIGNNRALNSWRFSHILPMLGINTAKPFMLLERRKLRWIPRESYFLCEVLEGKTVAELVEDENISPDEKSAAIIAFKALFTVMADYGISHGDLKATNFIYVNNKLYVLDLDAMKRHKDYVSFHKSFQKDLKRFVNNWAELVDFESITEQAIQVTNTYRD